MLTIGLTGGIGSGKTTVAKAFKCLGIPVYDSDQEAKKIMTKDEAIKAQICHLFSQDAYNIDGTINSPYIAKKAFEDKDLLKQMNNIVHPAVYDDFFAFADTHNHFPYIIFESAIIVETHRQTSFDRLIVVTAPKEERIKRVMERNNVTRNDVIARMKRQASDEQLTRYAHYTIFNDEKSSLIEQINTIHHSLC